MIESSTSYERDHRFLRGFLQEAVGLNSSQEQHERRIEALTQTKFGMRLISKYMKQLDHVRRDRDELKRLGLALAKAAERFGSEAEPPAQRLRSNYQRLRSEFLSSVRNYPELEASIGPDDIAN